MVMEAKEIIDRLPYKKPFLFVDELIQCDEHSVTGRYTFDTESDFYKGHFIEHPVTPGVILTETMAQIGLVCMGIYLLGTDLKDKTTVALSSTEIEFLKPVYPGEKVTVVSERIYFRFGKLKCRVHMKNNNGQEVCRGIIAGLIKGFNE